MKDCPLWQHFGNRKSVSQYPMENTDNQNTHYHSMAGTMVSEHVIRVICDESIIDPYYVYAYLATEDIGKVLLEKGIYASVVDHITPDFVATIPIPRLAPEIEKEIADKVREAERKRDEANRAFVEERDAIERTMFLNMKRGNQE